MFPKLNFIVKDTKKEFGEIDWPQYRIDTEDGYTVAEVFGDANQDLGRCFAAAPELYTMLSNLVSAIHAGPKEKTAEIVNLVYEAEDLLDKVKP
jgi:hypothetical protein